MTLGKMYRSDCNPTLFNLPSFENSLESIYDNVLLLRDFMYKIIEKYIFIYYKNE